MIDYLRSRPNITSSRGLADAVSAAIRDELIGPGERLPAIRTVAAELGLSPTTVSAAWALLARAGAISTDGRRGTTVAIGTRTTPRRYRSALSPRTTFALDLSGGVPDPQLLPDLAPALGRLRRTAGPGSYLDDPVLPELADVLAERWPYAVERFAIVDGAMDAVELIIRGLLDAGRLHFGDSVAVEDPTFPPLLDLLESAGLKTAAVEVDEHGPRVDGLDAALRAGARVVLLQPRGHNPTGGSLSVARARALAALLEAADVIAVEDDSTGDIATGEAISIGRWAGAQTLHIRGFSKSYGPDLRLAAIGGPEQMINRLAEQRLLGQGWTSRLLQALLVDLLTDPAAQRQVAAARSAYAQRRQALGDALRRVGIAVQVGDGINVWLPVREETAALVRLASIGIGAAAGRPFCVVPGAAQYLRITAGLIRGEHEQIAAELAEAAGAGAWHGPR